MFAPVVTPLLTSWLFCSSRLCRHLETRIAPRSNAAKLRFHLAIRLQPPPGQTQKKSDRSFYKHFRANFSLLGRNRAEENTK